MTLDENKLQELLGQVVTEMGAAAIGSLIIIGDKLGLYRSLSENGPLDSHGLANATGTSERYVREWLMAQAASGYIHYDSSNEQFSMSPEQAAVFATKESPVLMTGAF